MASAGNPKYVPAIIIALVLGAAGTICQIIGPDKLKDMTNEITKGLPAGVTDDKGHRHGFTERTPQPQHDAADNPIFGERKNDTPDNFPGGAADTVGRPPGKLSGPVPSALR